ncbi:MULTISPECIES: hypothetical protein [Streptomyces]|uniref:hypothetical protein n=1 Tax=Streptomyces TaxID=1883 RepID=UPI0013922128|nr:hypothetical protein [Streptomyces sp. PAMC 26508]
MPSYCAASAGAVGATPSATGIPDRRTAPGQAKKSPTASPPRGRSAERARFMSVVPVHGDPHSAVPALVQVGMTAYGPQGDIVDTYSCTAINSPTGRGSTC